MRTLLSILTLLLTLNTVAQTRDLLHNVYNRETKSLSGDWHYIVDPYENGYFNFHMIPYDQLKHQTTEGFYMNTQQENTWDRVEYDFDKAPTLKVPGDWNSQDDKLFFYEGSLWYKTSFNHNLKEGNRLFLYFGAVNYECDVYLNQKKLGRHVGSFTPFNFEITDIVKPKGNFLIIRVKNNRYRDGVPTITTDWWNYGGITRDVELVELPETFIKDHVVRLKEGSVNELTGTVQLQGEVKTQKVTIEIPEAGIKINTKTNEKGYAEFSTKAKSLQLWSPESPKLYSVTITCKTDKTTDQIGFRTIRTDGDKILLNGKSIFLRGICIHEEFGEEGHRVHSKEEAKTLLKRAKELNCNYVRLAHYPHNEHMVRLADKMGLMVWEEIPVYWAISWENEATLNNAKNQLSAAIQRDKNRASIIIWSMANETPISDARNKFLKSLVDLTRSLDPTRLVSAALLVHGTKEDPNLIKLDDPFVKHVDVVSFNEYVGWYWGLPDKCREVRYDVNIGKPVIISEFGGGAKAGYHGDSLDIWTEEFQAYLYSEQIKMLNKIDGLRGTSPWILNDFRSPRRMLTGIQDGWNRKGLFSNKGEKKKAFFIMKSFYEEKEKEYK